MKITEQEWRHLLCNCGQGPEFDHALSCPARPDVVSTFRLEYLLVRVNRLIARPVADDDLRDKAIDAAEGALVDAVDEPGQFLARVTDTMLERAVDAVLALADVDGLRAEADTNYGLRVRYRQDRDDARAERDAAVRDLAALRAGVEALTEFYVQNDEGDIAPEDGWRFVRDLRALLADPTPEVPR